MCAGAMLHARIKRVVFGAFDPKTGAAGSVVNLFEQPLLNHQTRVLGGILQEPCAQVLQDFFRTRRIDNAKLHAPLREDALRTPEPRFKDLPDYPWGAHYVHALPALGGWRMHYLDEGPTTAPLTLLCLHSFPGWSYDYHPLLPVWIAAGQRVVVPDLVGFGKSDKPKRAAAHTLALHRQSLLELVVHLDLRNVVLVAQAGDLWGCSLVCAQPARFRGVVLVGTHPVDGPVSANDLCAAGQAPFPDAGHQAALRAYPRLVQEAKHLPLPAWPDEPLSLEMNELTAQAVLAHFAAG